MIERLGIHPSVEAVFPPEVLRAALEGVEQSVAVAPTSRVGEVDGLVTFDADDAFRSADLAWIHTVQAGVDKFDLAALDEGGIALTNSAGIHGDTVGETVAGYMLTFARRLHRYRDTQRDGAWRREPWDAPFSLAGERVCVVGLGTLGRGVAARADALGMDVVGVRQTPVPTDHVRTVHPPSELHEAIADARFVVLAVPLTDETEGLVGADELEVLSDDAYLVNVARGGVLDQSALLDALENDDIAGAALDVFDTEPPPADDPLWDCSDVLVTPHVAGTTREYPHRVASLVRENVRRFDEGRDLVNRVV